MNLSPHIQTRLFVILFFIVLIIVGSGYSINKSKQNLSSQSRVSINSYIDEGLVNCYEQSKGDLVLRQNCFKLLAVELGKIGSFKQILNAFDQSQSLNSCHDLMHYLVNDEYRRGTSLQNIYKQCTSSCFGACYHGGLEGYFIDNNLSGASEEIINETMIKVCNSVIDKRSQCYHGLGHALMLISDGDLLKSLRLCDVLTNVGGNNECYAGSFMENSPNNTSSHPPKFLKESDPLYPCNILDKKYLNTCYEFQVSYFTYLAKADWSKVVDYCQKVPIDYQNICYERIGSGAPGATNDINKFKDICNSVPKNIPYEYCIRGVVDSFLDRYSEDRVKLLSILDFCPTVSDLFIESCYDQIGKILSSAFSNEPQFQKDVCAKISNRKFRALCLNTDYSFNRRI